MFSIITPRVVCCYLLFLTLLSIDYAYAGTFEEETSMTANEKRILDEFKKTVVPRIPEKSSLKNYVGDDLYFIRWLRATNFDASNAESMFMAHLRWREEQNIDKIEDEDWGDIARFFPMFNDQYDKQGRPVAEMWFSDFAVRTATIAGKQQKAIKYMGRLFEMESRRLFEQRAKGKEVAQTVMLVPLDGFNFFEQACPSCLPLYFAFASLYENHYPGMVESGYLLTSPPAFDLILRVIRPALREASRKSIKSYPSERQWGPLLDKLIEKQHRSTKAGGTMQRELN